MSARSFMLSLLLLLVVVDVPFSIATSSNGGVAGIFEQISGLIRSFQRSNEKRKTLDHFDAFQTTVNDDEQEEIRIWLTVSSVVNVTGADRNDSGQPKNLVIRPVEVHWVAGSRHQPSHGDYLSLRRINDSMEIRRWNLLSPSGKLLPNYIRTDVEFPQVNFTTDIRSGCLAYRLVYITGNNGEVARQNCIRLEPRWMEENFELLKDRQLYQLMIPGTHDASSYERYDYDHYENDGKQQPQQQLLHQQLQQTLKKRKLALQHCWRQARNHFWRCLLQLTQTNWRVLRRFQFTQDESLYNQLVYGVRYLDFRVAVYNQTNHTGPNEFVWFEEFWMVHDKFRNHITLRQALEQVRRFLDETTHELVVVDFHRFVNGFDFDDNDDGQDLDRIRQRLQRFVQLVQDHLGRYMIPYSRQGLPPLGELINRHQRVLIGYALKFDPHSLPDSPGFWPPVHQLWAQTDQLPELEQYIGEQVCKPPVTGGHRLRAVMAELTPTIQGVLLRKYHGLREMAANVNRHFERWFRFRWHNCTNIVAADFFLGSDIVQISIDVNRQRF